MNPDLKQKNDKRLDDYLGILRTKISDRPEKICKDCGEECFDLNENGRCNQCERLAGQLKTEGQIFNGYEGKGGEK